MPENKDILANLRHSESHMRLRAIREALLHITSADWEVWQRIEWLALYDEDPLVRQVALAALLTPQGQRFYQEWLSSLTGVTHQARAEELKTLMENGVVDPAAAAVVLDLYHKYQPQRPATEAPVPEAATETEKEPAGPPVEAVPAVEAPVQTEEGTDQPEPPPAPMPVAKQTGPSPEAEPEPAPRSARSAAVPAPAPRREGQLLPYVLVYVGAFLVAAASLLLAGIPSMRVPALFGGTFLFFVLAVGMWFVFRPGAAVFYALATFYLWADAYVVLEDLWQPVGDFPRFLFLFGVAVLVGTLWAIGTWAFRSHFFAVLTAMALPLGAFWLALALTPRGVERQAWSHAFIQAALVVQWGWTLVLRRLDDKLAWPARLVAGVFNSIHGLVLALSMLILFANENLEQWSVQIPLALAWLLLLVAFGTFLHAWRIPVWDEIGLGWSLFWLPLVWLLPYERSESWAAMVGLTYMALALPFLRLLKGKRRRPWGWGWYLAFLGNGAFLLFLTVVGGSTGEITPLLWSALGSLLALAHLLVGQWAGTWFLFLFWVMVTYTRFWMWLNLPDFHPLNLYAPVLLTWLMGVTVPLWKRRGKRSWMLATLPLALVAAFAVLVIALSSGDLFAGVLRSSALLMTGLMFLYWAVGGDMPFWTGLTVLFTYVAQGLLLDEWGLGNYWPLFFAGYPVLFLGVEQILATRNKARFTRWRWALRALAWGTILLFFLPALAVDNFSAPLSLFVFALVMAAYIVSLSTPWPGLPAALLFFLSAGKALDLLQVPHLVLWLSTFMGLLALTLYLLFRHFQKPGFAQTWALLGQLGMYFLSYVAWLDRDLTFGYFIVLFLQALVALVLGILLKDGIWLWPAIAGLVITVATAVIHQLGGIGVLLVVCGTGLLLLSGGLLFLYRRQKRRA